MVRFIFLFVIAITLTGCKSEADNEESGAASHGALVLTCPPNLSIYQWKDKLYYKERDGYSFRRVVATVDDVCSKFITAPTSQSRAEK